MKHRIFPIFLALFVLFSLFSCKKQKDPEEIRVYTLNGTTGFGMVKLMEDDSSKDKSSYRFTVKADASDVTAALISGDADIAALPTNAAANLYQKTNGGVKVLAINTLGCLYLVNTTGTPLTSLSDLNGKTVYTPAQNPAFLFTYLCRENDLNLTINSTSFAQPALLKDAVASGAVDYAVLPEPMVTIAKNAAKSQSKTVSVDFDLTKIWDADATRTGKLVQGCVVVRTEFLEKYPEAIEKFLKEYKTSVDYVAAPENVASAAELIAKHGIFENANVAKTALPNCNVHYLDGIEMKDALSSYLSILYSVNPASVGNALPSENFYFVK